MSRGYGSEATSGSTLWHTTGGAGDSAGTTITWTHSDDYAMSTPHAEARASVSKGSRYERGVDVDLFFRFLKTKFSAMETKRFKERMEQLEKMADEFGHLGQEAAQDECMRQFMVLMREAAIYACGYEVFLTEKQINKLQDMRLKGDNYMKVTQLKNFARILPDVVAKKVKDCLEKKLFDEYIICHVDDKAHLDTEDEKIEKKKAKERDPVMFGRVEYSSRYYFIIDWIDEMDTLQLKDLIKALSVKKADIKLPKKVKPLDFKKISREANK